MRIRRIRVLVTVLLAVALVATACSSGDELASEASVIAEPSESAEPSETVVVVEDADAATEEVVDEETVDEEAAPVPVTASTVPETSSDEFPDIVAAQATPTGNNTWRFDVTVSSTYDSPERYADAWRVVGPDGTEYGIRVLTHDHASEQPFTRSQNGIEIPPEVTTVTIEGRDLANGWGGGFLVVNLAGE